MNRFPLPVAAAVLALAALAPLAADEPRPRTATSTLIAATVYPDRALVTREARLELPAGETTLLFENLPASLLDDSVQLSGQGAAAVTVLDLNLRSMTVDVLPNARVQQLQDELRGVKRQLRSADDRAAVLQQQRDLLAKIATAATAPTPVPRDGSGGAPRPTVQEWRELLAFSEGSFEKLLVELQGLDFQREELRETQADLERRLAELRATGGRRVKAVVVRLNAPAAGPVALALRYAVPEASWRPAYDARLRAEERVVDLTYCGIVRQATGEDWKGVKLTLSTARPFLGGGAPELLPWIVQPDWPAAAADAASAPAKAEAARRQTFNTVARTRAPEALADQGSAPAELALAEVETGATSASFVITAPATLLSDNAPQKVGITTARLSALLQYQAVPKLGETAFVGAYVTNTTEYPLLAGAMNAFLGEAFVASSSVRTVMPGEKFELALGADEGIALKRRLDRRFSEETGLTGSGRRVTYEFTITVQNNKRTAERIVFKDQLPVSRDERIVVKMLAPAEKDALVRREAEGKLVWTLDLKPGEKRELPLKFTVEHPANLAVAGLE